MYGAKKLFSSGKMMAVAERGLPMSRLISGKKHKITEGARNCRRLDGLPRYS